VFKQGTEVFFVAIPRLTASIKYLAKVLCYGTVIPPTGIPKALKDGRWMPGQELNVTAESFSE
jgi:hypothetical protein